MAKESRIARIKNQLIKFAEDLMKLADDLSVNGKPLDSYQKELIRGAFGPKLKDLTNQLRYAYSSGDTEYVQMTFKEIDELLGEIERIDKPVMNYKA